MTDRIAYKVLTADQFAAFQRDSRFAGAPMDLADGYIHLSTAAQLAETIDKHFAGQTGLVILAVDLEALGEAVKWEPSRGGELFPHAYGGLGMEVVVGWGALERQVDGAITVPCAFRT